MVSATRVAIRVRHDGRFSTVVMLVELTVVEVISVPLSVILMVYDISLVSPSSGFQVKVTLTGAPSLAGSTKITLRLAGLLDRSINRESILDTISGHHVQYKMCIHYSVITSTCTVDSIIIIVCNVEYSC